MCSMLPSTPPSNRTGAIQLVALRLWGPSAAERGRERVKGFKFFFLKDMSGFRTRLAHTTLEATQGQTIISHRCYPREVAFEWQSTPETIYLPLGCLQGDIPIRSTAVHSMLNASPNPKQPAKRPAVTAILHKLSEEGRKGEILREFFDTLELHGHASHILDDDSAAGM